MNIKRALGLSVAAMIWASATQAHDPSEHQGAAESPDCEKMKELDHSKMDMNDPVMQAMMEQCAKANHQHDSTGAEKKVESMGHDHHKMMGSHSSADGAESDVHKH